MKTKTAILVSLLLTGCVSSPTALQTPDRMMETILDIHYQAAFKNIREGMLECSPAPFQLFGSVINDAQLYPDLQEGKFVRGIKSVGQQILSVAEVRPQGQTKTKLAIWSDSWREETLAQYTRWAMGGDPSCEGKAAQEANKAAQQRQKREN